MTITNVTKREATEMWVKEFNAIPISVLEKLQEISGYTDIEEITPRHCMIESAYFLNVKKGKLLILQMMENILSNWIIMRL